MKKNDLRKRFDEEYQERINFFTIMTFVAFGFCLVFLVLFSGEHARNVDNQRAYEQQKELNDLDFKYQKDLKLELTYCKENTLKIVTDTRNQIIECRKDNLNRCLRNVSINVSVYDKWNTTQTSHLISIYRENNTTLLPISMTK